MLKITRCSEYVDSMRKYKVHVDNIYVGYIRKGEEIELDIEPGKHILHLTIDWARSNKYEFDIKDGEDIDLKCGNSMTGLRIFLGILYSTIWKDKYLWIKE